MEGIVDNFQRLKVRGSLSKAAVITCACLVVACSSEPETDVSAPKKVPAQELKTPLLEESFAKIEKSAVAKSGSSDASLELEKEGSIKQEKDEPDLAEQDPYLGQKVTLVDGSEGMVEWLPPSDVQYSKADVTIVTQYGERVNYSFGPNEAMALESTLPDGLYQWESVVTPEIDPYVMEQMRDARMSGDMAAQDQILQKLRAEGLYPTAAELENNRQAGAFVVREGVVTPTTTKVEGEDG